MELSFCNIALRDFKKVKKWLMNHHVLIPHNKMDWLRERVGIFWMSPSLTVSKLCSLNIWGEATLPATYLIDHIPFRVLQNKSSIDKLAVPYSHVLLGLGLPLWTFGCVLAYQTRPLCSQVFVRWLFQHSEGISLLSSSNQNTLCLLRCLPSWIRTSFQGKSLNF